MAKKKKSLNKSLQTYFSKRKTTTTTTPTTNITTTASAGNWFLSPCNYPRTRSFHADDADHVLSGDFRSLCSTRTNPTYDEVSLESPRYQDPPRDSLRASDRFFVSPGTTSSLVEEARLSATSVAESADVRPEVPGGWVAVSTYSEDPCEDFRRSMEEMVVARHVEPWEPLDWEFMQDLLFCYLENNDRSVYKDILQAFADLAAGLCRRRVV